MAASASASSSSSSDQSQLTKICEVLTNNNLDFRQKKDALTVAFRRMSCGNRSFENLLRAMKKLKTFCGEQLNILNEIVSIFKSVNDARVDPVQLFGVDMIKLCHLFHEAGILRACSRLLEASVKQEIESGQKTTESEATYLFELRCSCLQILNNQFKWKRLYPSDWEGIEGAPHVLFPLMIEIIKLSNLYAIIVGQACHLVFILLDDYVKYSKTTESSVNLNLEPIIVLLRKYSVTNSSEEIESLVQRSNEYPYYDVIDSTLYRMLAPGKMWTYVIHILWAFTRLDSYKQPIKDIFLKLNLLPDIFRWCLMLPITQNDFLRVIRNFQLLEVIFQLEIPFECDHETLVETFDLLIYHPESGIENAVFRVLPDGMKVLGSNITKSKKIIKAVISRCFTTSFIHPALHHQVLLAFRAVMPHVKFDTDESIINYINEEQMDLAKLEVFGHQPIAEDIRTTFNYYMKVDQVLQVDERKGAVESVPLVELPELREEGAKLYQEKRFQEAIDVYTKAIKLCPLSLIRISDEETRKLLTSEKDDNEFGWFILPSVLHCNRAQCYDQLEQFDKALVDCDFATYYCDPKFHAANTMLFKCVFLRSTVNLKLCNYAEALRDAAFSYQMCMEDYVKEHFYKVYVIYREEVGIQSLQPRCFGCLNEDDLLEVCGENTYCLKCRYGERDEQKEMQERNRERKAMSTYL